jgi:hypothetical protein
MDTFLSRKKGEPGTTRTATNRNGDLEKIKVSLEKSCFSKENIK